MTDKANFSSAHWTSVLWLLVMLLYAPLACKGGTSVTNGQSDVTATAILPDACILTQTSSGFLYLGTSCSTLASMLGLAAVFHLMLHLLT